MAETKYILSTTKQGVKEYIALPTGGLAPHNQAWSTITDTPTTLGGYGITDSGMIWPGSGVPVSGGDHWDTSIALSEFVRNNQANAYGNFAQTFYDILSVGGIFTSQVADGATAKGFTFSTPAYTTAGAKIAIFKNNATEKASIDKDGTITSALNVVASGDVVAYQDGGYSSGIWDAIPVRYSVAYTSSYVQLSGDENTPTDGKFYGKIGGTKGWYTPAGGVASYPGAGIALSTGSAWGSSITNNSANWNTAYNDRMKWDGGATGLVAATGRTSLGLNTGATADISLYAPLASPTFTGAILISGTTQFETNDALKITKSYSSESNWLTLSQTTLGNHRIGIAYNDTNYGLSIYSSENGSAASPGTLGFYQSTTGKVGIANTDPSQLFEIGHDTYAATCAILINAAENQQKGIGLLSAGVTKWYMYNPGGSADLRFYNGTGDIMILSSVGRLSLDGGMHIGGTSDPGDNNLIVDGKVKVGSGAAAHELDVTGTIVASADVIAYHT
jgi:hypothetical protein